MSWWQATPIILGALALFLVPGYLIARACGAKGLGALALSAPLTTTVTALMAILAGRLNIGWSLWCLLLPACALVMVGLLVRRLLRDRTGSTRCERSTRMPGFRMLAVATAIAIPAALIGRRVLQLFGRPENVSQTYDGVFHLNALRYIHDSGSASSLTLGGMPTGGDNPSFYPAAWHGLVSLLIELTGAPIPVAANASNLVIAAVVWPLGCLFLCTRVTGNRPIPLLVTGILSGAFSAFPYLLLDFGVLYPNFLSIALLPTSIALAAMVLHISSDNHGPWLVSVLAFTATLPGIALAHPSTLMALAAFFLPLGGVAMIRHWRRLWKTHAPLILLLPSFAALLLYTGVVVVLWQELRPSEAASWWKPFQTQAQAVGEIAAAAPMGAPPAWMVMLLMLAGILHVILRRGTWWALGLFFVAAFLFVVVSALPPGEYRSFVTGVWYNDSFRLAALLPVTGIVLAAVGGSWILTVAAQRLQRKGKALLLERGHPRYQTTIPAISTVLFALVILMITTQGRSIQEPVARAYDKNYALDEQSPLLSEDERALIERLPEQLPEDAVVIGNPWTGTAYTYALAGIPVLTPHLGTTGAPENLRLLTTLDQAEADPSICALVEETGVEYVLEFGGEEIHSGDHDYPGVENLSNKDGYRQLDAEGDAVLYELTAC